MHILQILSGTGRNGAVQHALQLCQQLTLRGHRVTLVARPQSRVAARLEQTPLAGVEVVLSTQHRWPLDQLRRIGRLVREQAVDIVHTHCSRAHFFGVLLRLISGAPTVATAHNWRLQLHWMFNDRVIAVSEATARAQRRFNRVPARRLRVIPNFVDPARFRDNRPARRAIRREFGIDGRAVLLGNVSDLNPVKGLPYLLEAMSAILARQPHVRLLVVGANDEPFGQRMQRLARERDLDGRVLWAGHRRDVPDLLAAMDVLVHPSDEDQMPLAVLEGMAAGLPTVTTAVGGLGECVQHETTGLLVPRQSPRALEAAILRLVADESLRSRMGAAGRARIEAEFSPAAVVERVEAVYTELLAARPRRAA